MTKTSVGVLSTPKAALALHIDPLVAMNTSASDFTINDLVNYERPVSPAVHDVPSPHGCLRRRALIHGRFWPQSLTLSRRMSARYQGQRGLPRGRLTPAMVSL